MVERKGDVVVGMGRQMIRDSPLHAPLFSPYHPGLECFPHSFSTPPAPLFSSPHPFRGGCSLFFGSGVLPAPVVEGFLWLRSDVEVRCGFVL